MLFVTECSDIASVVNADAKVNGLTPDPPIEHGTEVHFECRTGYSSKIDLMAVCGGTTPGVVDVSRLECYKGNVLSEK